MVCLSFNEQSLLDFLKKSVDVHILVPYFENCFLDML